MKRIKRKQTKLLALLIVASLVTVVAASIFSNSLNTTFNVRSENYPLSIDWGISGDPSLADIVFDTPLEFELVITSISDSVIIAPVVYDFSPMPNGFTDSDIYMERYVLDAWVVYDWVSNDKMCNVPALGTETIELRVTFLGNGNWHPDTVFACSIIVYDSYP